MNCNKICKIYELECNLCDYIKQEYKQTVTNIILWLDWRWYIVTKVDKDVEYLDNSMNIWKLILPSNFLKNE